MKHRILIADDELPVVESLSMILREEFPEASLTKPAASGRQAIDIALTERPDIVLMDINMPGIDGLEALREIRRENPGVVAIIVSAYERFDIAKSAFDIGVHDYLLKPFNRRSVVESLESALQRAREVIRSQDTDIDRLEEFSHILPRLEGSLIRSLSAGVVLTGALELFIEHKLFPNEATARVLLIALESNREGASVDRLIARIKYKYRTLGATLADGVLMLLFPGSVPSEELEDCSYWTPLLSAAGFAVATIRLGLGEALPIRDLCGSYRTALAAFIAGTGPRSEEYEGLRDALIRILRRKNDLGLEEIWRKLLFFGESAAAAAAGAAVASLGTPGGNPGWTSPAFTQALLESDPERRRILIYTVLKSFAESSVPHIENLSPPLKRAVELIEEGYSSPLQLKEIAERLRLSSSYLSQLFSRELRMPFTEYLNSFRIDRALRLLDRRDLPIHEVSRSVGYTDPNYFSRIFKRFTGRTPREYLEADENR